MLSNREAHNYYGNDTKEQTCNLKKIYTSTPTDVHLYSEEENKACVEIALTKRTKNIAKRILTCLASSKSIFSSCRSIPKISKFASVNAAS
jgi:hypothetical protein